MNTKLLLIGLRWTPRRGVPTLIAGLAAGLALQFCPTAVAQSYTVGSGSLDETIPDNQLTGLASPINVNVPLTDIASMDLTLDISGGWNGDYYAYVQYSSGLVVLLNNLGGTLANPYGSPGAGFNVTFSDAAPDISTAPVVPGQPLTGTYAPQGGGSLDGAFGGLNPKGTWTLFIADESPGGIGTLESWSLELNGPSPATSVPDRGATMGLLAMGMSFLALFSRRRPCISPD